MVGEEVKRNLKDRLQATKDLAKDEIGVFKDAFQDVKGRIIEAREPTMGKKYGVGFPHGIRGGLIGTAVAIPVGLIDGLETFVQKQGEISRRWFK